MLSMGQSARAGPRTPADTALKLSASAMFSNIVPPTLFSIFPLFGCTNLGVCAWISLFLHKRALCAGSLSPNSCYAYTGPSVRADGFVLEQPHLPVLTPVAKIIQAHE